MPYNPKLAAGNQQSAGRHLFGREQVEQLRARAGFSLESNNLKKLNEANAQFWSEQDEKAKR